LTPEQQPTGPSGTPLERWTDDVVDHGNHGEEQISVTEAGDREYVRPVGWSYGHATLDVEDAGNGWVKLLWRCDAGDRPPAPYTMFDATEKVWIR
jgi:hypothetical protein